jgi:hypothetical protein
MRALHLIYGHLARVLTCTAVAVAAMPLHASTFSDGPGGATCSHFSNLGRLAWVRPGGDWVDAAGKDHGNQPFAEAAVSTASPTQPVSWDVLPLLPEWTSGRVPSGSMLLRVEPGAPAGPVSFASREHPDETTSPSLAITWSDGKVERLSPIADTFFACPTLRNLGGAPELRVGADRTALLEFPFRSRPGQTVSRLSLSLTPLRLFGRSVRIGLYGPQLPRAAGPEWTERGLSMEMDRDDGIARHKDVLYAQNFDDDTWKSFVTGPKTAASLRTLSEDTSKLFVPIDRKALSVTIPKNGSLGMNHQLRFAGWPGGEPEEAYFRYHLRLSDNWNPVVDGGKMPGFAGTYGVAGWGSRRSDGTNGWSARGAFMRHDEQGTPASPWRAIGSYAYTASNMSNSGQTWGWNLGPTGRLTRNRWYSVEQYLKLNTPGQTNGVLRAWIDGQLAFERTDLHWRDVTSLKIESVWLNVFHGGTARTDRDLTLYMDNLIVARRYIGPGNFSR